MTDYANAPQPQGALFDTTPQQTTYTMHQPRKTSADYTPAVAVWPSGRTQAGNVLGERLDSVEQARRKLASGLVAWVRREDVEAVTSGADASV
jgi:hypothetical protein